ncbi:MAG: bifunctional 3-(3-hydroxy-phenyl)propionate/3-hydroxycinnamic acid hydroxylase [Pseudomonadota bacterium]
MTVPPAVTRAEVAIVGAGPTGLLLANLLGAAGVSVVIIERNANTVQEPRAVSIDDESMRALQAAGLDRQVDAITASGYGSLYRGPTGAIFASVKPTERVYGFEKRNAFEQPVFEALLRDGLSRFDGVTPLFQTALLDFQQTEEGVVSTLRDAAGVEHGIRSRYLVGCDGGRSAVRKALGIAMEGATFEEPWLIVDLFSTKNRCFHTEVFCDPARAAITLPGPGGIRRYEFKLNPGETAEAAEQEPFARDLLARVGPDSAEAIRRTRVYTFHARVAARWRVDRVFLAGDAAHLTPPFAGQGMNSGLRDAHNLAWKLAAALRADDPEALLDSYETERKPHAQSMIDLAMRMGRVMMPRSAAQGALVRGAFRALGLVPSARDYFAQMRYKPKPRFAQGMIWADDASPKRSAVGQMIPQPIIETPDRRTLLLDDWLPGGVTALVFAEDPAAALDSAHRQMLEAAGATVRGLTPEWMNPSVDPLPSARDRSRLFSAAPYRGYLGHVLLLRSDRYLAASAPAAEADRLAPLVRALQPAGAVVHPPARAGDDPQSKRGDIADAKTLAVLSGAQSGQSA